MIHPNERINKVRYDTIPELLLGARHCARHLYTLSCLILTTALQWFTDGVSPQITDEETEIACNQKIWYM